MVATSERRRPLLTSLLVLSIATGAAGCDLFDVTSPSGQPPFSNRLYAMGFDGASFQAGRFDGQDQWFAALGPEAATVISRDVRSPRSGSYSLRVEGARLQALQGFFFGSYARPLNYAPLRSGTPRVRLRGWVALAAGDDGPTCGLSIGVTSTLNGDPVPNILIGIQKRDNAYVSYLSNYDGEAVYGPSYVVGSWVLVTAILDFEERVVDGYANARPLGRVRFTNGIGDEVTYLNIALGSNQPIPGVNSYFDDLSLDAGEKGEVDDQ